VTIGDLVIFDCRFIARLMVDESPINRSEIANAVM